MSTLSTNGLTLGPTDRAIPTPISARLERSTASGRGVFAAGIAALGAQCLVLAKPVQGLEPLPTWLLAVWLWPVATGVLLIGCGAGIAARRLARLAALVLGGLFSLWLVLLHAPQLVASPANGGAWTVALETLAFACATWAFADTEGSAALSPDEPPGAPGSWVARLGRIGFGASLLGFGVLHLIYWEYVSSVIPAWLPGHLFWTYGTAAAFFAAGAALITGIQARQAATWTGIMFLLWVAMLHLPRVAAKSGSRAEWTSMLIALVMGGGAWIIARVQARS